jgi:hypothetical protein
LAYEPNPVKPEPKKVNLKRAFDPGSSPQQALIGGREGRKKHKGLQLFLSILARPAAKTVEYRLGAWFHSGEGHVRGPLMGGGLAQVSEDRLD